MLGGALALTPERLSAEQRAGEAPFGISHGPYLLEPSEDGVTVAFCLSAKGAAHIEVREHGKQTEFTRVSAVRDGLKVAYTEMFAVTLAALKPATAYQYRIVAKTMKKFHPYSVEYGQELTTDWYEFKTCDPAATECAVIAMSDLHNKPKQLEKLLRLGDYWSMDLCFLVGDIISDCTAADLPYTVLIDKCVEMFATTKPFVPVRGNHETRGAFARRLYEHFPTRSGQWYGSMRIGDTFFIYLDSGEDKPDDHWAYFGLADFDQYRTQEAQWLAKTVKSEACRQARHRIVFSHFPISELDCYIGNPTADHGVADLSAKCLPILNEAAIDLCVSGHTHRFAWHDAAPGKRNFPLLVGSNADASRLDIGRAGISVRAYDMNGKTLLEKRLK